MIQVDQIERWKHEYPEWRKPESEQKKDDKIKGKEVPNFCGPDDSKNTHLTYQIKYCY